MVMGTTRRKFIRDTGMAAIAGSSILAANTNEMGELKNVFVHHVYFWLKNKDSREDLDKLVAGLRRLSAVKTIRQFHIGVAADTNREVIERSYSVSWLVLFDNGADQASYQTDPIHLKFVEECSSLWQKVIVYDSVNV